MPLSEETKRILVKNGREDLIEVAEIKESGYAGMLSNGNIVDRRKHPEAIPIQENSLLGTPKPRPLPVEKKEYLRATMIFELSWNLERFPLPICMEPREEQKQLNLRMARIGDFVDRYIRLYHKNLDNE